MVMTLNDILKFVIQNYIRVKDIHIEPLDMVSCKNNVLRNMSGFYEQKLIEEP